MIIYEKIQVLLQKTRVIQVLEMLIRHRYSINKRIKLYQIKYFSDVEIDRMALKYYLTEIKPNLIVATMKELDKLRQDDYIICIVSGGYDVYLKFFAEEFKIDKLLCTKVEFKNGKCTGKIYGNDCMMEEKTRQMNNAFPPDRFCSSVSFSDSPSDIPMMKWTDEAYVVLNKYRAVPQWVTKNKFNVLLWE